MSSKRRLRRRACENKRRYEDRETAEASRQALLRLGRCHPGSVVYGCSFCGGFHIGRRPVGSTARAWERLGIRS